MLRTALRARDIATFGVGLVFVLAIARIQTRFLSHAGEAKSAADAAWRLRRREKATAPSDRPSFKKVSEALAMGWTPAEIDAHLATRYPNLASPLSDRATPATPATTATAARLRTPHTWDVGSADLNAGVSDLSLKWVPSEATQPGGGAAKNKRKWKKTKSSPHGTRVVRRKRHNGEWVSKRDGRWISDADFKREKEARWDALLPAELAAAQNLALAPAPAAPVMAASTTPPPTAAPTPPPTWAEQQAWLRTFGASPFAFAATATAAPTPAAVLLEGEPEADPAAAAEPEPPAFDLPPVPAAEGPRAACRWDAAARTVSTFTPACRRKDEWGGFDTTADGRRADKYEKQLAGEDKRTGAWAIRRGQAANAYYLDTAFAAGLAALFAGGSVYDFGAGVGCYTAFLRDHSATGARVRAYDGVPGVRRLTRRLVGYADLSRRQDFGCAADWVLALEILEHVPPAKEATILANVHRHNKRGVVLSWARPGQGGFGHRNERPTAYVRALFEAWGYGFDREAEERLRAGTALAHFKRVMIFRRKKNWKPPKKLHDDDAEKEATLLDSAAAAQAKAISTKKEGDALPKKEKKDDLESFLSQFQNA